MCCGSPAFTNGLCPPESSRELTPAGDKHYTAVNHPRKVKSMIVRQLEEILNTDHDVKSTTWNSRRLLLARDGMGFSMHDTVIYAGTETPMWYKHHLEAVYCIEGEGEVEALEEGQCYPITPGTLYALDRHDRHVLRATTTLRLICVFNPPLTGQEVHDVDGAYPAAPSPSAN